MDTTLIPGGGEVTSSDFRHGYRGPGHEMVRIGIKVHRPQLTLRY